MVKCANCGISIRWKPTLVGGRVYCCVGCSHGGPCSCDYGNLPTTEHDGSIVVKRQDKSEAPWAPNDKCHH